jgi:large subunit ribosomal protein L4
MTVATKPMKARYFKADGKPGQARELPEDPFDGVVREDSIYAAIKAYRANQRRGTGAAKNRAAVRGGGRKPWRQKGTGRARHGSIRSPIWRGGGVAFPPTPRSFGERLPKKVRHVARRSAFSARAADDRVVVIEALEFDEPKTRKLRELLSTLEIADGKVLILTAGYRPEVYLSGRNMPEVEVREWGTESVYDLLWARHVLIEAAALEAGPDPVSVEEAEVEDVEAGEDETELPEGSAATDGDETQEVGEEDDA